MTTTTPPNNSNSVIYQGQFGEFTIDAHDRREVQLYRTGLAIAALSFAVATGCAVGVPAVSFTLPTIAVCYGLFTIGLGLSLWTIHIYLKVLHRALQAFWAIGTIAAIAITFLNSTPFALTLFQQPLSILGIGFTFAALTGIYFKEAFCFNRLETKLLTPIVPVLLLGHLLGMLPLEIEKGLAIVWAGLFLVFAARKLFQAIPDDIGDKSVFLYLKQQKSLQSL